jgi:tetratricopeptide (TPR) repeat protein
MILGATCLLSAAAMAQTTGLEGVIKGEDGKPIQGALVHVVRTDIKAKYELKTDKKGHYGHYGLPLGTYNVSVEVNGKVADSINGVRTHLGDPLTQNFDLKKSADESKALAEAAATGTLTKEQSRSLTAEQKAALEKQTKEREAALSKNKALQDAFNEGKTAFEAKNYDQSITALNKAAELDPSQVVVWSTLADAYLMQASTKTGAEADDLRNKGLESYKKAIAIKPDDPAFYNNYALGLAKAKKFDEMSAALDKAAQLDPTHAGRYYFNLGAVLTNAGQADAAGEAFKKAITLEPTYADAQYQYGIVLMGKAKVGSDGKVTPVPGTVEAFQKYLELAPTGPNADAAKAMLASMEGAVATKYVNPDAPKSGPKKKK